MLDVKIKMVPNKTYAIDYAKQVKDIAKDLISVCKDNGVINLTYSHDFFEIQISKKILLTDKGDK